MTLAWMDIAWKQEGVKEISGAQQNPKIIAYFAEAGHPEVHTDEVPWCAAFACSCLEMAGIHSPRSLAARDFLNFGTPVDTARYGAIAVFSRPPNAANGHVGFVAGEEPDSVVLLGGNQANAVSVIRMPKTRLLGYRWPDANVTAAELKAAGSRTIAAADKGIKAQVIASGGGAIAAAAGGWSTVSQTAVEAGGHLNQAASTASQLQGSAAVLHSAWLFMQSSWLWLAALAAGYFGLKALYHLWQVKTYRTEDANTGAHQGVGGGNAVSPADDFIR